MGVGAVRAVLPYCSQKDEINANNIFSDQKTIDDSKENEENNDLYCSTASTASTASNENTTDPELARTTEYLKNLQEAEQARKGIKKNVEQS
jgi:hypothetical protein